MLGDRLREHGRLSRRSRIEPLLAEQAAERRRRLLGNDEHLRRLPPPIAWLSPESILGAPHADGHVPLAEAAERMQLHPDEVLELVERGALNARLYGTAVYVQPAIVQLDVATLVDEQPR